MVVLGSGFVLDKHWIAPVYRVVTTLMIMFDRRSVSNTVKIRHSALGLSYFVSILVGESFWALIQGESIVMFYKTFQGHRKNYFLHIHSFLVIFHGLFV